MKAHDYESDLTEFLKRYSYQPDLTKRLDELSDDFSDPVVNEIVLWKVNRFVSVPPDVLALLNQARDLRPPEHRDARQALSRLLDEVRGVDLPMASTFLRFRNPKVFQIMDRHAYRALYGRTYDLCPSTSAHRKIEAYFQYLDDLRELCEKKNLDFDTADRLLYIFDKEKNGSLDGKPGRRRSRTAGVS